MSARASSSGLTYARLRSAVRRDSFSDYLPLVAWEAETEAFLHTTTSFRDAPSSGAGPESIFPAGVIDSGLAREELAPRNDAVLKMS